MDNIAVPYFVECNILSGAEHFFLYATNLSRQTYARLDVAA
jgi:hypothetical protein